MGHIAWRRLIGAALVGYVVAMTSLTLLFGNPISQRILFTSEAGQADKVLSVWLEQEPLPAVTPVWDDLGEPNARQAAVQGMLVLWALALTLAFAMGWAHRPGPAWRRGLTFGVTMWAVLFLFFEAWVPLNVLGEPFALVLFELGLELVAMIVTGVAIALLYRPARSDGPGLA